MRILRTGVVAVSSADVFTAIFFAGELTLTGLGLLFGAEAVLTAAPVLASYVRPLMVTVLFLTLIVSLLFWYAIFIALMYLIVPVTDSRVKKRYQYIAKRWYNYIQADQTKIWIFSTPPKDKLTFADFSSVTS